MAHWEGELGHRSDNCMLRFVHSLDWEHIATLNIMKLKNQKLDEQIKGQWFCPQLGEDPSPKYLQEKWGLTKCMAEDPQLYMVIRWQIHPEPASPLSWTLLFGTL